MGLGPTNLFFFLQILLYTGNTSCTVNLHTHSQIATTPPSHDPHNPHAYITDVEDAEKLFRRCRQGMEVLFSVFNISEIFAYHPPMLCNQPH